MLQKILNIAKISQLTQNSQVKTFNTTLPLLLEILQKTQKGYLLKLGNATMEAKSNANLQIGTKYWAIIKDTNGEILISNLQKQPKIMESIKHAPLNFTLEDLPKMAKNADFVREFRDNLLDFIINAKSKDEFLLLSNSLLALQQGILNLVIKDKNRRILLQITKQKHHKIHFSAIFSNLGIINGILYNNDILHLNVCYEHIKKLLENNANKLDFSEISISVSEDNKPLFDIVENFHFSA